MAGLPIIVSDLPEMRNKIEHYRCGLVCENLSSVGIRATVENVSAAENESWGRNARQMAEENCWENQEKKLLTLYENVLKAA